MMGPVTPKPKADSDVGAVCISVWRRIVRVSPMRAKRWEVARPALS